MADTKTEAATQAGRPKPQAKPAITQDGGDEAVPGEAGRRRPHPAAQVGTQGRFGIEMTTKAIATYRSDILKKRAKGKAPARPTAARPETAKPKPPPPSNGKAAVALEDVLALKSLVERVGAENLRTLIAAFERVAVGPPPGSGGPGGLAPPGQRPQAPRRRPAPSAPGRTGPGPPPCPGA